MFSDKLLSVNMFNCTPFDNILKVIFIILNHLHLPKNKDSKLYNVIKIIIYICIYIYI